MGTLSSRLRIGEKIGFSTALVGLLLVGVIWQYHLTLQTVLGDYERLQEVFEKRKSYAFEIEIELAGMLQAERDFLIHREEGFASRVDAHADALLAKAETLAKVDAESQTTARDLQGLVDTYRERFRAIADAWRVKGLDEDSGLQGAFRRAVHELQDRAGHFNVDRLYLRLMQIHRNEKGLALRREAQYEERVRRLIAELRADVQASELEAGVKERLLEEIGSYSDALGPYAAAILAGEDTQGGRGPFRDAALRIEDILKAHYVPELETNILALRRREKDYLLRGDPKYVEEVAQIAQGLRAQIGAAPLAAADKQLLIGLLDDYERDFLALVGQDERIAGLTAEMRAAASEITPLVKRNLDHADGLMASKAAEIAESSRAGARRNLVIVAIASALGFFLALTITLRIVRPVREMAGLLDRLTYESPRERIATVPGGRDEINAMAESLNTMADHRANFVQWWKSSMQEALALRDLNAATADEERDAATAELRAAALSQVRQMNAVRGQVLQQTGLICEIARDLGAGRHGAAAKAKGTVLERSARGIETLLQVVEQDACT